MISPAENPPGDIGVPPTASDEADRPAIKARHWILVWALLLGVTWVPLLSVHLHRTWLGDDGAGTVVVVFPPTASTRELFRSVIDAGGGIVRPVSWAPRVWVVRSTRPGFAGRLRRHGAWGVFSSALLDPSALFDCFRLVPARPAR